jgi:hypothetical protein
LAFVATEEAGAEEEEEAKGCSADSSGTMSDLLLLARLLL